MYGGEESPLTQGVEGNVAILGSSQTDYFSYVDKFPLEGETILGTKYQKVAGGRGANQSIMCNKLMETGEVVFISCIGDDEEGQFLKKSLKDLSTEFLYTIKDVNTSISHNIVCKQEKTTILIPGANDSLSEEHIEKSWSKVKKCKVFLCQLENKPSVTLYGLKKAKSEGITTIFNPSPATKDLSDDFFLNSDIVCPNEVEAEIITGIKVKTIEDAYEAALAIIKKGSKSVVMTLGEKGSIYVNGKDKIHVPVNNVKVVDTSGAGDCFVGSLAYFIASGINIVDSISLSCYLASFSIQYVGVRESYPERTLLL